MSKADGPSHEHLLRAKRKAYVRGMSGPWRSKAEPSSADRSICFRYKTKEAFGSSLEYPGSSQTLLLFLRGLYFKRTSYFVNVNGASNDTLIPVAPDTL